jgi:hypothetical protein
MVAKFEQAEDGGLAARTAPRFPCTQRGPKYDSPASNSPLKREWSSHSTAILRHARRKIVFGKRAQTFYRDLFTHTLLSQHHVCSRNGDSKLTNDLGNINDRSHRLPLIEIDRNEDRVSGIQFYRIKPVAT